VPFSLSAARFALVACTVLALTAGICAAAHVAARAATECLKALLFLLLLLLLQGVKPAAREWISFYKPNLTVALVDHFQAYPKNAIPPQVSSSHCS
jgi:uncharacterized membrane protein YoaK (UPF0700 family)